MNVLTTQQVEELFSSLESDEKVNIISHGVALRLADLRKRFDMARERILQFEKKYGKTLDEIENQKLPDSAGYEMHEDYVMWHHWVNVLAETQNRIASLDEIAQQGLYLGESFHTAVWLPV